MTVKCQSTWKEKSEKDGVAEEDDKLQEMWRGKEMEQFVFENEKKKNNIKDFDMLSLLWDKVSMLMCEGRVQTSLYNG